MPSKPLDSNIEKMIERVRQYAAIVGRLATESGDFRELCEHLDLALRTLTGLEARPDAASRALVADYGLMIEELENDLAILIAEAAAASPPTERRG